MYDYRLFVPICCFMALKVVHACTYSVFWPKPSRLLSKHVIKGDVVSMTLIVHISALCLVDKAGFIFQLNCKFSSTLVLNKKTFKQLI